MAWNLAGQIVVKNPSSNIDGLYGPWASLEEACNMTRGKRAKGRTVGILADGKVTEYWFENGIEDNDLVIKNTPAIHVGTEPPNSKNILWMDTSEGQELPTNDNETYMSIMRALRQLQKTVSTLSLLRTNGVVSGNITDSTLNELSQIDEPVKPSILDEDEDERTEYPDYEQSASKTINHISIKIGTFADMKANRRHFIEGEPCWCTDKLKMYIYYHGSFYPVGSGSSGSNTEDDMDYEQLQGYLDKLGSIAFVDVNDNTKTYTVKVDKYGALQVYDSKNDTILRSPIDGSEVLYFGNDFFGSLFINSVYIGGLDTDEHSYQPCSHNFVELSNISNSDISLNGLILMYTYDDEKWEKLSLWGVIKAHSTFLIRGAQCSVMDVNTTKLKVKTFDLEWVDSDGNLIKFNRASNQAAFYLCWADQDQNIFTIGSTLTTQKPQQVSQLIDTNESNPKTARGYVDLVGIGTTSFNEKKQFLPGSFTENMLFTRWYTLDPVSQSNAKTIDKRSTVKFWKWIDLRGSLIDNVEDFTPKASWEGKNQASDKHKFSETEPNCLTCCFGINGSVTQNGTGATRCFTWTSVNYFDEYLWYREVGQSTWQRVESYKEGVLYTEDTNPTLDGGGANPAYNPDVRTNLPNQPECIYQGYSKYYLRMRWETHYGQPVTTHKVMVANLEAGTYEYCVGRPDSNGNPGSYISKTRRFTVKAYANCAEFDFIQTTDQQGANWEEYQVWTMSAMLINRDERNRNSRDFDFTVNTGDICYNGSRPNEWIDYYEGYKYIDDKEENFCIGNNDLAPMSMMELGDGSEVPYKANHIVFDIFYTTEIDVNNPPIFKGQSVRWGYDENGDYNMTVVGNTIEYKMRGLYSFNYGPWHFICLNSELRTGTGGTIYGPDERTNIGGTIKNTVTGEFGVRDNIDERSAKASVVYDYVESWMIKDLMQWKGMSNIPQTHGTDFPREQYRFAPTGCGKCIIYTHEMPFTITASSTYESYAKDTGNGTFREKSKANLNLRHNFEFQRLWKAWGVKLIFGGHKHTCSISYPVYDAPTAYNPIVGNQSTNEILMQQLLGSDTFKPITQVSVDDPNLETRIQEWLAWRSQTLTVEGGASYSLGTGTIYNHTSQDITVEVNGVQKTIPANSYDDGGSTNPTGVPIVSNGKVTGHLEIVSGIPTAPVYVMCQATGFKNKSNSDTAANLNNGWLKDFVPEGGNNQCYPFYTRFKLRNDKIDVDMYRITGLYTPGSKAGYWTATKELVGNTLDEARTTKLTAMNAELWGSTSIPLS